MELNRREFLTTLLAVGAVVSTPKFILAGLPVVEVDKDVAQQIADKEHKPVSEVLWRGVAIYYDDIGDDVIPYRMIGLLKQDATARLGIGACCELRTLIMPEDYGTYTSLLTRKTGIAWVYGHQSNIGRRCSKTNLKRKFYPGRLVGRNAIQKKVDTLAPVLPGPYRLIEPFVT